MKSFLTTVLHSIAAMTGIGFALFAFFGFIMVVKFFMLLGV